MKSFPYDVAQSAKGMRFTLDRKSVCFDFPEEHMELVEKVISDSNGMSWLEICTDLPPLADDSNSAKPARSSFGGGRGGGPGRGGANFGRGGFNDRRGRGDGGRGGRSFGGRVGFDNSRESFKRKRED